MTAWILQENSLNFEIFVLKISIFKNSFMIAIRVSNSSYPDQAQHYIVCHEKLVIRQIITDLIELYKFNLNTVNTVKPVLSCHSKRRQKLLIKTDYDLMQVKSIAE